MTRQHRRRRDRSASALQVPIPADRPAVRLKGDDYLLRFVAAASDARAQRGIRFSGR